VRFELRARCGDHRQHLIQDEQPRLAGLFERLRHQLSGDTLDLDVHLQGSDALGGASDFEIHIAKVIFHALDVGQDLVASVLFDQSHGDASYRRLDRHAGIHQRQGRAAHRGHRRGTVRCKHFGNQPQRVWEFVLGRDDRY